MKKKILLSVLCICMVLVMMPTMVFADGEPPAPPTTPTENVVTDPVPPANTEVVAPEAPTFTDSTAYIFENGRLPRITLTVSSPASDITGTCKVYTTDTGNETPAWFANGILYQGELKMGVNASDILGTYWISYTPTGGTESARAPFNIVAIPPLEFALPTVYKTSATQENIDVQLVGDYAGVEQWLIYDNETDATRENGISGTNSGNVLTLTKTTGVSVGTYYIAMVKHGQPSPRVRLNIAWEVATVSVENGMKEYVLEWGDMKPPVNLVMHKEDKSQTLNEISYLVGNEKFGFLTKNSDYTISNDGTTVTFNNDKIKAIIGAVGNEGKSVEFGFHYDGGPKRMEIVITITIQSAYDDRELKGNNSTWQSGSASGLDFEAPYNPNNFQGVLIDGSLIRQGDDYTLNNEIRAEPNMSRAYVHDDSTLITLTPKYLSSLTTG
ncbi:MAG: hypothetical protein RR769_06535, partial [Anaerovoracaceae bacterium]